MFAYKFCKKSTPTFRSYVLFMHAAEQTLLIPLAFTYWEGGLGEGLGRRAPKIENMQTLGEAEGHALNTESLKMWA